MYALRLQPCFLNPFAPALRRSAREIQVIGIGHLAAAVRLELARRGAGANEDSPDSPLLVVCSDFHNPAAFVEMQRRAWEQRLPALFASLSATEIHPRLLAIETARAVVDQVMGM